MNIPWSEYEQQVFDYFKLKFGTDNISRNIKLKGSLSFQQREIDILIEAQVADQFLPIAIECKKWKKKLDVADIAAFIDKLKDLKISKGIIVSQKGYSKAAYSRMLAENDLQLMVLDFSKLDEFRGFWANPYNGKCGALISAPSGWIIDWDINPLARNIIGPCMMYPMGMTLSQASEAKNLAFFYIFSMDKALATTIKEQFLIQNNEVLLKDPKAKIKMWDEKIQGGPILYREIYYATDDYTEYSGGVETDRFLSYVMITSLNTETKINLARLRYIMNEIQFIVIDSADPDNPHESWTKFLNGKKKPAND